MKLTNISIGVDDNGLTLKEIMGDEISRHRFGQVIEIKRL